MENFLKWNNCRESVFEFVSFFFFLVLLNVKLSRIAIFHVLFFPTSTIGLRLTELIKIRIGEMDRDSFDNEGISKMD